MTDQSERASTAEVDELLRLNASLGWFRGELNLLVLWWYPPGMFSEQGRIRVLLSLLRYVMHLRQDDKSRYKRDENDQAAMYIMRDVIDEATMEGRIILQKACFNLMARA